MAPEALLVFLFFKVVTSKRTAASTETIVSIAKDGANGTFVINADVPTTNNKLKILLPTILPMAISAFPFFIGD